MKKSLIYLFFLPVFFFASCDDIIIENTPANVFEVFWRTMDENYVFFEEKGIDWDSIHRIYAPKARMVKNDYELSHIFHDILPLFQDGHLSITRTCGTTIRGFTPSAAVNCVDTLIANGFEIIHSEHPFLFLAHKEKRVVYFRLNTFRDNISTHRLERLLNNLDFANGLIIDLSNNLGGYLHNVYSFASAFFTDRKKVLYAQRKTGRGRNDFSDKMPKYLQGRGYVSYDVPLVILTSPGTFSAGNIAVYMLADLRDITTIGAPTSGGGGSPHTVALPNGWMLSFPYVKVFSPSGRNMEFRFEPEIYVELVDNRLSSLIEFRENMLGAALEYLDGLITPNP